MENMIEFEKITKRFPGNIALNDVSFAVEKGEVHALLGENGAGKSTLLNILHGVYGEYQGRLKIDGEDVHFKSAHAAIEFGVSKVHQEVSLVEDLSVGQNTALGYEIRNKLGLIDYKSTYKKTDQLLERLGCPFTSKDIVKNLSIGDKQMILIAKALFHNAKIISFDEPTTALTDKEVDKLFSIIQELKKDGITIIYVTHRMNEVYKIADRATILRDGKFIATNRLTDITREELIKKMVGREVEAFAVRTQPSSVGEEVVLEVENLSRTNAFENVSFKLHKGEILSFSGLVGAGRTEVMRVIFGADKLTSGSITLNGEKVTIKSPKQALRYGIGLIPENRKAEGFVYVFDNAMNMAIASIKKFENLIFISRKKIKKNAEKFVTALNLVPRDPTYMTQNLSGGNQQKVIIGKWLTTESDIIIFDEPTKGIDVGAKAQIYSLMEELVSKGKSILMVSSELPEVIGMSDRVIVMREGRKVKELSKAELTEEKIMYYAMEG